MPNGRVVHFEGEKGVERVRCEWRFSRVEMLKLTMRARRALSTTVGADGMSSMERGSTALMGEKGERNGRCVPS